MSEPRKHHYVPVFYQQLFSNSNGLLWVYDRSLKTCKQLHPRVICFQSDLYTIRHENAPWERRIETEVLTLVDGSGSTAIHGLLSGSTSGETIRTVAYFMGVQSFRIPWFARHMAALYETHGEEMMRLMTVDAGRMQSVLDRYKNETGEAVPVSAESLVESVRENQIQVKATETPFLTHIFSSAEDFAEIVTKLNWQILESPPGTGFIICDNPVTVVPPPKSEHVGLLVRDAVIYYPLDRRRCLRLSQHESMWHRKVSKETLRVINLNIAANSERFILGPDKAQIMSLVIRSGSVGLDSKPRHTIEKLDVTRDGSYIKDNWNLGRYFYAKGNAP